MKIMSYIVMSGMAFLVNVAFLVAFLLGFLPLSPLGFVALILALIIFALLRPRLFFWVFLSTVALETVIVSPEEWGFSLRPFQLLGAILILATLFLWTVGRLRINLPGLERSRQFWKSWKLLSLKGLGSNELSLVDLSLFLFLTLSFLGLMAAPNPELSAKLGVVLISFFALYWLVRSYSQAPGEKIEALWFFLVGSLVTTLFAWYQAVAYKLGGPHFEVFLARTNGTFSEPDWLGIYLTFILAVLLWSKYALEKNTVLQKVRWGSFGATRVLQWILSGYFFLVFGALFLTVSRSAWLGFAAVVMVYLLLFLFEYSIQKQKQGEAKSENQFKNKEALDQAKSQTKNQAAEARSFQNNQKNSSKSKLKQVFVFDSPGSLWRVAQEASLIALLSGVSVGLIWVFNLSSFHFFDRFASSFSGRQMITVSCQAGANVPGQIENLAELDRLSCRHIDLEQIEVERLAGRQISQVYRPDPNVGTRKSIYSQTLDQIKANPFLGRGLGSSSDFLGLDSHGSRLNSSNIFLEGWVSAGLGGLLILLFLFLWPIFWALRVFWHFWQSSGIQKSVQAKLPGAAFLLLATTAFLVPNLFNSGLFLGFFWIYLAVTMPMSLKDKS